MSPDLVVVGNLIVDDIVCEDGSTLMAQPGGAILYMGLTAHLWGIRLGLVSVAGSDYPRSMLDALSERGVDVEGIRLLGSPGLRTWLLYEGAVRRVVHRLDGATHGQASPGPTEIPSHWRPRAIHLAPMALELQGDLASDLTARLGSETLLSVDPFELLTAETLCDWRALLNRIDLLFLGEDEMATAEDRRDPEPLLRGLLTDRLRTVFYKQGRRGGIACRADRDATTRWPARANRIADTTGAGDAFACGVLAGVLTDQPLTRALEWGVVSASFAIEGQGASGLLEATPTSARDRHYRWFGT